MSELDAYDYHLPAELIAQEPLARRADSRLMLVDRQQQTISHLHFRDLPDLLRGDDALVLNDTQVVPAKLVGYRDSTGGRWQGLYLDQNDQGVWRILCKTRGKLVEGETIGLVDRQGRGAGKLTLLFRLEDGMWAAKPDSHDETVTYLQRIGRVPLPHYIRRGEALPRDLQSYQTVFASQPGSVAAPTAGLHFTQGLLQDIDQRGVTTTRVTLHVGVGTFRPIKVDRLDDHQMHAEWCELTADSAAQLNGCRQKGGRIVAVGTTSVRTLETAAADGELNPYCGHTDLFIRSPYTFHAVDALVTNFHLPRSSLLVLVTAFAGSELIRQAYSEAIEEEYRFFSYGDAMMIL